MRADPKKMAINPPKGKQLTTPYTGEEQFSELVTCRIDGELMRLIEEQVQNLYPYYRTKSDFVRDALFKWSQYLHDVYFSSDTPSEPLALKIELLSKQAYETQQRREFTEIMGRVNDNLRDLMQDTPKLAEEVAGYAEKIQDLNDDYWRDRAIREFVECPIFPRVLDVLKKDTRYANTPLVKLLSVWNSQKFVIHE